MANYSEIFLLGKLILLVRNYPASWKWPLNLASKISWCYLEVSFICSTFSTLLSSQLPPRAVGQSALDIRHMVIQNITEVDGTLSLPQRIKELPAAWDGRSSGLKAGWFYLLLPLRQTNDQWVLSPEQPAKHEYFYEFCVLLVHASLSVCCALYWLMVCQLYRVLQKWLDTNTCIGYHLLQLWPLLCDIEWYF